ncbi:MAG: SH3 domain-containing protein, partial [Cyanobacteriota bacterium]|nr:SH3 domain-containing protein [Cyanobacteriota bacterium]
FYGFFKFLVGVILAVLLLAGASVAAVLYFAAKLSTLPEKPVFPNEQPTVENVAQVQSSASNSNNGLEPGAYRALVVEPIGLILRDTPTRDAVRIGGISYNEEVIVLEETADKRWQRVRVNDGGDRVGWVSGGNTEPIN